MSRKNKKNFFNSKKVRTFAPAFEGREVLEIVVKHNAEIAQLVEHDLAKVGVASSSLVFRSILFFYAEIAQLVEHDLAKVGVASSSLVFRSKVTKPN